MIIDGYELEEIKNTDSEYSHRVKNHENLYAIVGTRSNATVWYQPFSVKKEISKEKLKKEQEIEITFIMKNGKEDEIVEHKVIRLS